MLFKTVTVPLRRRAFIIADELPVAYLGPGRHWVRTAFRRVRLLESGETLAVNLPAELVALVPQEDLKVVVVAEHERALVLVRGRPRLWLGPGEHQIWTLELVERLGADGKRRLVAGVEVRLFDTSSVEAKPFADDVKALVPAADYSELLVPEGSVALRYVDGSLESVLPAGRHAVWTTMRRVSLSLLEMRERLLQVTGQEVMTKDRVTLRLNLSAAFVVSEARRFATVAREAEDILYLAVQLAAREAVASRTLDELLAAREALATELGAAVAVRAHDVGLEVKSFGLKDIVLPGEMRALLNRVTEAQKEAEANVILRREETAATRSLAQTAKLLAENPLLVRLKELEAYKDLAARVGQVHLVLGEAGLPSLKLETS